MESILISHHFPAKEEGPEKSLGIANHLLICVRFRNKKNFQESTAGK